ncbi:hypothetical protein DWQ65_06940 [Treponema phagedenis]|uniref:Tetratricopeptide repeat protein n=1 Tax=Treponema phagedenis TaxID=162 RepID=A0A0B7GYE0_TREPH|nr:tetratricopeptide repeat protein [Treponema phagedenis]EFW38698.1 tetratricopeptide repeat protein [Treponema phagedenis F0421]NVP25364.1 tetratricopeptide repeat protein [Treponema phagedenis]QEJ94857.1 tetratricopeptide repeat protein [Treponema phagedenis]QEJ97841.1 tetratricopeptide repeat protein [Treponema phagedenis]QEK00757.1 tetratricopeptide repeat protein [Treponema phagedenis]
MYKTRKYILVIKIAIFCTLCFFSKPLVAFDYFNEGKKLLMQHEPDKAVSLLFKASQEDPSNMHVHLYLGVAYLQTGKYVDAIYWLQKGKEGAGGDSYLYDYNLGNAFFMQNRYTDAEKSFTETLTKKSSFAPAVLNRANTYMKQEEYDKALQDYKTYLNLDFDSSQRPSIQRMISLLEARQHEIEIVKIREEARKAAEAEEKRLAEERYKNLRDSLETSLQDGKDADSISAGSEDTINYSEDYKLE